MAWLKSNWRWAGLNLFAVSVVVIVWSQGSRDLHDTTTFDPMLESGKWAVRFLLLCLAMSPLSSYFGWRSAIKLRKPAGLWAFGFAALHVLSYMQELQWTWRVFPPDTFISLGLLGLLILAALAITSNRWAMQWLGKSWKRLHRLVYLAGLSVIFHAILATGMSKKILIRDPQAIYELNFYLALLAVLLVVRIPLLRRLLKQIPLLLRPQPKADPPVVSILSPDKIPEYRPKIYEAEMRPVLDDLPGEIQVEKDIESRQVVIK